MDGEKKLIMRAAVDMNRLRKITVGGNTTYYTYRPDGMRATKSVGSDVTSYLYDGQSLVAEKVNDVLKVSYTNGLNEVISRTEHDGETADTIFFLYDANCNVNAIVDEDGELVKTFDYEEFGALRPGQTPYGNNQLQFAGGVGHLTDDSGLIYMRARYYDPAAGRFISEDPARNGTNWYVYSNNNPISFVDPTGEGAEWSSLANMLWMIGGLIKLYAWIHLIAPGFSMLMEGTAIRLAAAFMPWMLSPAEESAGIFMEAMGGRDMISGVGLFVLGTMFQFAAGMIGSLEEDSAEYLPDLMEMLGQ